MIKVKLNDGTGAGHAAKITHTGELVTVRGNYDQTFQDSLALTNTAYNLVVPKTARQFIITGIVINADKNVSVTDGAVVEVYEATDATTTTATKTILTLNIGKNSTIPLTGILIQTTKGTFLNAKTDDATVNITLLGYYLLVDESENG